MQEELQALDAEDRRGRSLKICNRVLELPVWKRAQVVVVFEPFSYEPEIAPLIADLRRARQRNHYDFADRTQPA